MRGSKKCVRCSAENDPGRVYCINCGKFLSSRAVSAGERTTVWDMGGSRGAQTAGEPEDGGKYVLICPQCRQAEEVLDGTIPFACGQCGYLFQAGIDQPVLESSARIRTDTGKLDTPPVNSSAARKNPLAGGRRDMSELILIPMSQTGVMPEQISEKGALIGEGGTVLRKIQTKQQLSIWHSPGGWYARALQGQPLYNGVPVNTGAQVRLSDGDMLTIEREQIRVEIV